MMIHKRMEKSNILRAIAVFYLLLITNIVSAQSTKIKGRVIDDSTGEGIPFVGIYFKNTTIGVSSDMDGYYTLETRDAKTTTLCATILGYESKETEIKLGNFQEVNFKLHLINNSLNAIVVKPDNRRMKRLMAKIDEHRKDNDPERKEVYQCDIYNKMEIDLTNADEQIKNKLIRRNFGFVFDYMDTSVVSGRPYLPIMISETVSRRYHKNNPSLDKEVIEASQISGINDENMLSQFTGSMHLKTNFYNNFINAFNVEIPSPISPSGWLYYNYFLIDSLNINGRKTYNIRFHPKKLISSPVFDGEMNIDAEEYALQEMHVKLKKGSNVNWIRDLVIDVEHQRVGDSTWFYKQDKMYIDFSAVLDDSSKVVSFLGRKQMDYSNPEFKKALRKDIINAGDNVMIHKDATTKSKEYWQAARPYVLSEKEQNIYNMVDSIKNVPLYRDLYTVVATFVNGYYDYKKISFGPVHKFISFNNLEGLRLQFGIRTSADFSKKIRYMIYGAYGAKDRSFKGGGSIEYLFSRQPTRKLSVSGRRDIVQLGRGHNAFTEGNIFSSILSKAGQQKLSPINEYIIQYDHEWTPGFNSMFALESKTFFSNRFVPMITPKGEYIHDITSNQAHLSLRFSWDETVTRGVFIKKYVHTKYPVITFDFTGGLKGIVKNDYSFLRGELTINYRLATPPAGYSRIMLNAGKIFGTVPYPLLKLHEGNGTYFLDKSAFACMNFYEFASDTWATFFLEHNFNGFFLGKIPLLRKMQLREVYTLKAAYGTLSEKNNGAGSDPITNKAVMFFPQGMTSLKKPYVEMGVGVTNIFRLFRIDTFWRVTHRYKTVEGVRRKADNRFAINFGIELKF